MLNTPIDVLAAVVAIVALNGFLYFGYYLPNPIGSAKQMQLHPVDAVKEPHFTHAPPGKPES